MFTENVPAVPDDLPFEPSPELQVPQGCQIVSLILLAVLLLICHNYMRKVCLFLPCEMKKLLH